MIGYRQSYGAPPARPLSSYTASAPAASSGGGFQPGGVIGMEFTFTFTTLLRGVSKLNVVVEEDIKCGCSWKPRSTKQFQVPVFP